MLIKSALSPYIMHFIYRKLFLFLYVFIIILVILLIFNMGFPGAQEVGNEMKIRLKKNYGRFGQPIYELENAPPYFNNPQTSEEILDVIRILHMYPPEADIEYHDYTDAWAPYLQTHRKENIAELLIRLGKYDDARDEIWSLFSNKPVIYKGEKLYYGGPSYKAKSYLFGDELWDPKDMEKRLKGTNYFEMKELFEIRKKVDGKDYQSILEKIFKLETHFNMHFDDIDEDFYSRKAAIIVEMFLKNKDAVYPITIQMFRKILPEEDVYGRRAKHLIYLLRKIGNPGALRDLVMGIYYPLADSNSLSRYLMHKAIETLGNKKFLKKFYKIHDVTNFDYLRPFHTINFKPVKMEIGTIHESLAEFNLPDRFVLIPDEKKYQAEIEFMNLDVIDKRKQGKLIVKFEIVSCKEYFVKNDLWYKYKVKIIDHKWLEELFE